MKKFIRVFYQGCKKMFSSTAFFVAVIAATILFVSTNIYVSPDTGKAYNLLSILFSAEKETIICELGMSAADIFLRENSGYIIMFAPIVAAIPYISVSTKGNANTNLRFELYRSGKTAYVMGNLFSAMMVGGILIAFTYCIYGVMLCFVIGVEHGVSQEVVLKIITMFFYGAAASLPAYFLHIFLRNKYIVLCIPFMLNYLFILMFSRLLPLVAKKSEVLAGALEVLLPSNIQNVWNMEYPYFMFYLVWYTLLIIIGMVTERLYMERRCDCGGQ